MDPLDFATGEQLDRISCNIYCCIRKNGETDHDYRQRIKDTRKAAGL